MTTKSKAAKIKTLETITILHQSIGANLNLRKVGRILVREIISILSCDICALLLFKNSRTQVIAGYHSQSQTISHQFYSLQKVDTSNLKKIDKTIDIPPQVSSYKKIMPWLSNTKSAILAPIKIKEKLIGILNVAFSKQRALNRNDLLFIDTLTHEIAPILKRSFKYSKVKFLAEHDGLTKTYNRRKFDRDIELEIKHSKESKQPLSLLMLDIDWFRKYNNMHGHQQGDYLLKRFAKLIKTNIRPLDNLYRYGGEEFTVLLPKTQKQGAQVAAKRINQLVYTTKFKGEEQSQPNKKVTVSIGVAIFPRDAKSSKELIKAADSALYKAKEQGRNRVVYL